MKRIYYGLLATMLSVFFINSAGAQTVGIGTDFPTATLDIVSTTAIPGARVTRSLTPANALSAAVEINDDSDWGALDIYYTSTDPGAIAASYVENYTGGYSYYINNVNLTTTASLARFVQFGVGDGLFVQLFGGFFSGLRVDTYSDFNDGVYVDHTGFNSYGLYNNNLEDGTGVYNDLSTSDGIGLHNKHSAPAGSVSNSVLVDMSFVIGYNYAFVLNAEDANTSGFFAYNMDIASGTGSATSGDGWMHDTHVYSTSVPTVSGGSTNYWGGAYGADQYGNSVGLYINQHGTAAANTILINSTAANTYPVISAQDIGEGGIIYGENSNSAPAGLMILGDFRYVGTDVIFDHIGVAGISSNDDGFFGYGIGSYGAGGWIGVAGRRDQANGLAGVYSEDELGANGAKMFVIDHPLDPEHKMLRHFSMESNEVLNVYQGTDLINRRGVAVIMLPDYFEAINVNYSYQLTPIGTSSQPWISSEVRNNKFVISGQAGTKVSWMVIANRNDAYAQTNPDRLVDEVDKRPRDIGKYLNPRSHNQPDHLGIFYVPPKQPLGKIQRVNPEAVRSSNVDSRKVQGAPERELKADKPEELPNRRKGIETPSHERLQINQDIKTWDDLH